MEESQLRQVILGKLRDQTLPRDASFANTIPAFLVVISMLCCSPGEVVVANEVLDGTNMIGQLLGEG
jgi:hypothetical protein